MLNQRAGNDLTRTDQAAIGAAATQTKTMAPTAPTPVAAAIPAANGQKRKLTFKEKTALQTLPKTIEALQQQIARHQTELSDAQLYTRNPKRFADVSMMLASAQAKLATAENEWLELEMAQ
jgi:ABC transport system ATP-binding/permease protein